MKKRCVTCNVLKDLDSFYSKTGSKDKKQSTCKICMKISNLTRKTKPGPVKKEIEEFDYNSLNLIGTCKRDYCEMYSFLSKIGYNPEMDIHTQFCEKWGITDLKMRTEKNKNQYTYQDCKK